MLRENKLFNVSMREDIEIHMKNSKINLKNVADKAIDQMVSIVI